MGGIGWFFQRGDWSGKGGLKRMVYESKPFGVLLGMMPAVSCCGDYVSTRSGEELDHCPSDFSSPFLR